MILSISAFPFWIQKNWFGRAARRPTEYGMFHIGCISLKKASDGVAKAFEPVRGWPGSNCVLWFSQHTDPAAKFCLVRNREGVVEERQSVPFRHYEPAIFKQGLHTSGLAGALPQGGGNGLPDRVPAGFVFFAFRYYE